MTPYYYSNSTHVTPILINSMGDATSTNVSYLSGFSEQWPYRPSGYQEQQQKEEKPSPCCYTRPRSSAVASDDPAWPRLKFSCRPRSLSPTRPRTCSSASRYRTLTHA